MSRTALLVGLILLAALVPLAAMPLPAALFTGVALTFLVRVVAFIRADVQPVALLALTHFRAPPSR